MIIKSEVQKTIVKEVSLKGVGLHTGEEVVLNFKPASANTGFVFVRTDLNPNVFIPAEAQYVINTDRGKRYLLENILKIIKSVKNKKVRKKNEILKEF